jgi:hypothetical protein
LAILVALLLVRHETGRICERERIIEDIGVAVVRLPIVVVRHGRISRHHLADDGLVDAAVHVHEADGVELLVAGVAAGDLAGEGLARIERVILAGRRAALAPGVEAVALHHRAGLVGQRDDRAEMVLVEVAGLGGGAGHLQRHHLAAQHDVVVPGHRLAGTDDLLRHRAADGIVEVVFGRTVRAHLLQPGMLAVIGEAD